ncbi:alpha/beta fold hydrolase [Frankia sp. QA3]|uniref:alpha/beta fold hydrolase n=1 Tax=Frankia sp. QA3 TaxID=710111 RepID=UPI0007C7B2B8|nr:alpha/beta hydrolase [Frankia sp. QA3]
MPATRWGPWIDERFARPLRRGLPASARTPGVRVVEAAGALLRVRDVGHGRTLVFVADPPVTVEAYSEVISRLAGRHRVVVLEPPGFGFSTPPAGFDGSFAATARVVEAFLAGLGGAPMGLVFPCAFGYLGLDIATRRPDLVDRLVLTQAPGWAQQIAWRNTVARRSPLRLPGVGQLLLRPCAPLVARRWLRAATADATLTGALVRHSDAAFAAGAMFALATAFQAYLSGPAPTLAPAVPVTLLWGDADRSHRASDPQTLRDHVPAVRIHRLPGTGHFPELQRPDALAAALALDATT